VVVVRSGERPAGRPAGAALWRHVSDANPSMAIEKIGPLEAHPRVTPPVVATTGLDRDGQATTGMIYWAFIIYLALWTAPPAS
jgi:hypothetical protein